MVVPVLLSLVLAKLSPGILSWIILWASRCQFRYQCQLLVTKCFTALSTAATKRVRSLGWSFTRFQPLSLFLKSQSVLFCDPNLSPINIYLWTWISHALLVQVGAWWALNPKLHPYGTSMFKSSVKVSPIYFTPNSFFLWLLLGCLVLLIGCVIRGRRLSRLICRMIQF